MYRSDFYGLYDIFVLYEWNRKLKFCMDLADQFRFILLWVSMSQDIFKHSFGNLGGNNPLLRNKYFRNISILLFAYN